MPKLKITDEHTWSGEWFLPEHPDKQVAGVLRWNGEARLELNDAFGQLTSGPIESQLPDAHPVIHGLLSNGHAVTLLNTHRVRWSMTYGSGGTRFPTTHRASFCLMGAHVVGETTYRSMQFEVPGLELWLAQKWFAATLIEDQLQFHLSRPDSTHVRIEAADCELELGVRVLTDLGGPSSISGRAVGLITTRSPIGRGIEWHLEQFGKAIALASMLAGTSFAPVFVRVSGIWCGFWLLGSL